MSNVSTGVLIGVTPRVRMRSIKYCRKEIMLACDYVHCQLVVNRSTVIFGRCNSELRRRSAIEHTTLLLSVIVASIGHTLTLIESFP